MKHRKIIVILSVLTGLLAAGLSGFVLINQSPSTRVSLALSVAVVIINILATPLFLSGLKHFKVELRKAYVQLCVGIGLLGLAQIQLPLVSLYAVSFWADMGLIGIPYLVSIVLIFSSMRKLSSLLGIKSIWRSWLLALVTTAVVSFGVSLLPHLGGLTDELSYDLANAVIIWDSVFITFTAILTHIIRRKIGVLYDTSMAWLFGAFATLSFAAWHYVAVRLLFTVGDWYFDYSIVVIPFIFAAIDFVIAGYIFSSINIAPPKPTAQDLIAKKLITELTPVQEAEVITYMTNLISNPADVTDLIDEVHATAAKFQSSTALGQDDIKGLKTLYDKLEDYLTHRDSLRVFSPEELRDRIAKKFNLSSTVRTTLWTYGTSGISNTARQLYGSSYI